MRADDARVEAAEAAQGIFVKRLAECRGAEDAVVLVVAEATAAVQERGFETGESMEGRDESFRWKAGARHVSSTVLLSA